ncbi:hypothetical protein BA895_11670 [Humibacillus sp. DSM 29435]|uniref:amidohydrolase n=1 Tax=Humibacillus sp. DSM 29435 TaxID=1869167 RepID=UPI0008727E3D|nr:amidohydrolase [Humibacillus sp. DSM 29435]OFE14259.1 hypothetical protein BA895_11670 [Humibacillus sp. DSM 29435]
MGHIEAQRDQPVTLFTGRRILALDGTEPECLAVQNGLIVATGARTELRDRFPGSAAVDLGGVVIPGLNDAHCHPSQAALARVRVDLSRATQVDEVVLALRARAAETPAGTWMVGQGLDEHLVTDGAVDRAVLDTVSSTHPVVVIQYTFHRAVTNTRGLALLGYERPSDAPPGGQLLADPDGRLNGWLLERAWLDPWLPGRETATIAPAGGIDDQVQALASVNAELHAVGITSYCDAIVTPLEQALYAEALARGALTPRVGMLLWHTYFDAATWNADDRHDLRMVGVKMMLDGALSGGTCLCQQPYASATGTDNGLQILGDADFHERFRLLHEAGVRVAVHANGDLAVSKVLDVVEEVRRTGNSADHPADPGPQHRVEHCSIVSPEVIERLRANHLVAVPFGAFPMLFGDALRRFYGDDRMERVCAHRALLDAGIEVAGSSDYPIISANPMLAVQSMVTRRTIDGRSVGLGQRVSVLEALGVYTRGSAHATGEADVKGQLTQGQYADFAVLQQDPTQVDPHELAQVQVDSTWVGGECVWHRPA